MKKRIMLVFTALLLSSCNSGGIEQTSSEKQDITLLEYGSNYKVENTIANQEYLPGMCFLEYEWNDTLNDDNVLLAFKNLGVKSLRTWMHFSYFMSNPYTIDENKANKMHEYLAKAQDMGFQIIGMNHYSYIQEGYFSIGKEKRVHENDSQSRYCKWLDNYEDSWFTLANEFQEINYWEIDNEIDNPDFMFINNEKNNVLNQETMAHIACDMLYRGSIGIHRANCNANTIMGGLVDSKGLGQGSSYNNVNTGTNKEFLELLYDYIDSGEHGSLYYDDFFQIAAWHPYYYIKGADQYFIDENNAIYEIIKRREGKDKKVFLTEFGWNDIANSKENVAQYVESLFVALKQMPYVESLHYFLMFDNNENSNGLFSNPKVSDASPKLSAYAYQKACNGEGDLNIIFLNQLKSNK